MLSRSQVIVLIIVLLLLAVTARILPFRKNVPTAYYFRKIIFLKEKSP